MSTSIAALVVTGLVAGVASGVLGIGGAILLVPILVLGFGFSQAEAQGTSIGALVPPIGILAAIQYYRNGLLDVRAAALIACGFVLGALAGASIVPHIPQLWLKRAFASLLVYIAAQMVFAGSSRKLGAVLPGALAIAGLWVSYGARRLLGKATAPPTPRPPTPHDDDTDYHI